MLFEKPCTFLYPKKVDKGVKKLNLLPFGVHKNPRRFYDLRQPSLSSW